MTHLVCSCISRPAPHIQPRIEQLSTSDSLEQCATCSFGLTRDTQECLVQCLDTGLWYCNNIYRGRSHSCIVQHLTTTGYNMVQLHPLSKLQHWPLRCCRSGERNVFSLGAVVESGLVTMLSQTAYRATRAEYAGPLRPLVDGNALATWLVRPASDNELSRGVLECLSAEVCSVSSHNVTLRYCDVSQYQREMGARVKAIAAHENKTQSQASQRGITVTWDRGLDGAYIAIFQDQFFATRARVRDIVVLTHDGDETAGGVLEAWSGSGAIIIMNGDEVTVAVTSLAQPPGGRRFNFCATLSWSSASYDRMQTAIATFTHLTKLPAARQYIMRCWAARQHCCRSA